MATVSAHGKCILLGEHSILRGGRALVFPLPLQLSLLWHRNSSTLKVEDLSATAAAGENLVTPIRLALLEGLNLTSEQLPFDLQVKNTVPTRAGLGSSAALTVALSKFLAIENFLPAAEIFDHALQMENVFHGNSSGLDVAAALSDTPLLFEREKAPTPLSLAWKPNLFLCDTGIRSATKDCLAKVAAFQTSQIDNRMKAATEKALEALYDGSLSKLTLAIQEGETCFADWNLIPASVALKIKELKAKGALAVKPTGSGDGGYLLSLWPRQPSISDQLKFGLTQVLQ